MKPHAARRSDRISIELPIIVTGSDAMGAGFLEQGMTAVIGRHGAKILLQRKLVPHQEINIRCLTTGKECDARIIGQVGGTLDGFFYYGVELLSTDANIWDIDFPPVDESEVAVGRILLECIRCHSRELVYLHEIEAEVFEVNRSLSRHCRKCGDLSVWRETHLRADEELPTAAPEPVVKLPPPPPPQRTRNDRKHLRLDLKVEVCVRHPQYGEEVVETVNVSRGGFRFKSRKHYGEGWVIEAALPYQRGGANIFAAARIVYVNEDPAEGVSVYGVAYIPSKQGWPGR
jgi:hypothetical protein